MKTLIKNLIEKTGYSIVNARVLRHSQSQKLITRDDFFNLYFSKVPKDFFFVQIGANDGVDSDPLYQYVVKHNLSGVAVEPQPEVFKLLEKTYAGYPVKCINVAIGHEKVMPFYCVDSDKLLLKPSLTGLASFRRDVLRKNLNSKKKIPRGANPDDYIKTMNIKIVSFEELTKDVKKIDFLQIDCEGYDFEILKMVDFNKFSPSIINFESGHLSEKKECEAMLTKLGYQFFNYGDDTCAYKL